MSWLISNATYGALYIFLPNILLCVSTYMSWIMKNPWKHPVFWESVCSPWLVSMATNVCTDTFSVPSYLQFWVNMISKPRHLSNSKSGNAEYCFSWRLAERLPIIYICIQMFCSEPIGQYSNKYLFFINIKYISGNQTKNIKLAQPYGWGAPFFDLWRASFHNTISQSQIKGILFNSLSDRFKSHGCNAHFQCTCHA